MLNLDVNGFKVEMKKEYGFYGKITHASDNNLAIYLAKGSDPICEKYGLPYMAFIHLDEEKAKNMVDEFFEDAPEEMKSTFEKMKPAFVATFLKYPIIRVDELSIEKLKKHDIHCMSILYHELGHFVHSDDVYEEGQTDRGDAIINGRVIQAELDADAFAFSKFGEDYYDALRTELNICLNAFKENDDEHLLPLMAELKKRIDYLIELIKQSRGL